MAAHRLHRYPFKAMGSFCELQFYLSSGVESQKLSAVLIQEVERLEAKYSRYRPRSYLQTINNSAGTRGGLTVDSETASLLDHAANCYHQSNGLFDITSGVLRKIWDFKTNTIPSEDEIEQILPLVGWDKVQWSNGELLLTVRGMEIDFGGIVKEYAADCVSELARKSGVKYGLVNLGGDFSIIGSHPDGRSWNIGIQHPRKESVAIAQVSLSSGALATSGDYERFFIHNNKRYSHILDPLTGWPNSGLSAVSIVAEHCVLAGSVATIAMLKREDEAIAWLKEIDLPHLYMTSKELLSGSLKQTP